MLGAPNTAFYYELNVVLVLHNCALFVPEIYATSPWTIAIGHHYGMPKQAAPLTFELGPKQVASQMELASTCTAIQARLIAHRLELADAAHAPILELAHLLSRWALDTGTYRGGATEQASMAPHSSPGSAGGLVTRASCIPTTSPLCT